MIQFNELRVTPDNKYLVINTQVQDLSYYKNVYIDSIVFDTNGSYSELGPSKSAIVVYQAGASDKNKKVSTTYEVELLQNKMFFVYVYTKGDPASNTPCGMKESVVMGVTYNRHPIYNSVMKVLRSLEGCGPSYDFINFFLKLKAFEISLNTGNYLRAIQYWNKFFSSEKTVRTPKCGCI